MYQQLIIAGYLGSDPMLRVTPTGKQVTNLSVATSRSWNDGNGNKVDETTWFRVSVWNGQAASCEKYLSKGDPVLVIGRLRPDMNGNPRTFLRQDGTPGATFEVNAINVRFLPKGGDSSGEYANVPNETTELQIAEEDEIPF
jgi:single-strand DNA-binding protein